jgi:peptidoglycan/LPS O-acetylase OafA/YrhL
MRINSLDGLRGIAILFVLLIHHNLFNNGWMGVDLFFVLSGFLITQILWSDRKSPLYWRMFYIKRATRILPPLVLTILLAWIFTPRASVYAALCYLFTLGGFMELTKYHITPLGPLWSLAVEEHFYLLWPFAVRFLPRRGLFAVLALLILGVPVLRLLFSHPVPMAQLSPIYFITPFRIDEMAFGCLLAVFAQTTSGVEILTRWSQWLFLASAAVYLGAWQYFHHVAFFPGAHTRLFDSIGYSLVAVICFAGVAHVRFNPEGRVSRCLAWRPLVFLGRISYGVYLYHLLVKTAVMHFTGVASERAAFLVDFPCVILVAWLSFRFYETPIMHWGKARADMLRAGTAFPSAARGATSAEPLADQIVIGKLETVT